MAGSERLTPGAHHYTFLESIDAPMGLQGIDEFMEALIAPPDRLDAGLAVARASAEATELGQSPHHLPERERGLRWGAVLLHGINGMPLPGFTLHVAGRIGIGATSHGNIVDPPGHNEIERHGVQQPLLRLHA
jgi:hypothetical protein